MADQQQSGPTFSRLGVDATPRQAAVIRDEFSSWLARYLSLGPVKSSDVLLAVNEALANAAEFAYRDAASPGVMHTRAVYDPTLAVLTVTVSDEGVWRTKDRAAQADPARGRGVTLMNALTDSAAIEATPAGTRVRLRWDHIHPSS